MNYTILLLCSLICINLNGQNKVFAKEIVKTLTSEDFAGRGYVNDGHNKAANFIAEKFKEFGLEGFDSDYKQEFQIDVNTFNGNSDVKIDIKKGIITILIRGNIGASSLKNQKNVWYRQHK